MRTFLAVLICATAAAAVGQEPAPAPPVTPTPATTAPQAPVATPAAATPAAAAPASASDELSKSIYFGKKFFERSDYASAYEQFAKADVLRPDQPSILYDMALVLAKAGRYSESQVKVDRYVQLYPNGSEKPLISQLQLDLEFNRELQKKRQASQDYADLFNRAKYLYGKNDYDAALRLFEEAEHKGLNDPAALFDQSVIYEKKGEVAKATEKLRRYLDLETDPELKAGLDQRLFLMETQIDDMRSKIVCSFCGYRLPMSGGWCPRCWHGPYMTTSAVWNSRPCMEGATATRATYYADGRFKGNETLPCLFNGPMSEALRYTPIRQRQIQETRKSEGWTYSGEVLQGWSDKQGGQVRLVQGNDYLERILSISGGEILTFDGHKTAEGSWLPDHEEAMIEGQKYRSRYSYDSANRVAQQQVDYQNASGCNHLIAETADYTYQNDALTAVRIHGGYDGYVPEGSPRVDWDASVAYAYDAAARVVREDLAITSFTKTYTQKPLGALRDEISNRIYPGMRVRKPIEGVLRTGDICALSGNLQLGNPIDLRPFHSLAPSLAVVIPYGVGKTSVAFTYPDAYKFR